MIVHEYEDGYLLEGDGLSDTFFDFVKSRIGKVHFINIDPPYGNIVDETWDKTSLSQKQFCDWMLDFTVKLSSLLEQDSAIHIWGGIGIPKFRPFPEYMSRIEAETSLTICNLITWSKRRAYGVQNNYLFTREECLFLTNGDKTHPRVFNIPLLSEKRGYKGFNKKYPAKSEYKRRTNVWTDVTELFRGKIHPTQKPTELIEISVQTHCNPGEWVLDCFAGSGSVALAARKNGRKFVVCEKDPEHSKTLLNALGAPHSTFEHSTFEYP